MAAAENALVDTLFQACVDLLNRGGAMTGLTYREINIVVFCVLWPLLTLALVWTVIRQRRTIRELRDKRDAA